MSSRPRTLKTVRSINVKFRSSSLKSKVVLILAAGFVLYMLSYRSLGLPSNEDLVRLARDLYKEHGYLVALAGAVGEGLLVAGMYLPGSTVVMVGAAFSAEGLLDIRIFTFTVIVGFSVAYIFDYLLGRYGWYRLLVKFGLKDEIEKACMRLEGAGTRKRVWLCFVSYFNPNTGSICATTSGVLHVRLKEFFFVSMIGNIVWTSLWAFLSYQFGPILLEILSGWLSTAILIVFLLFLNFGVKNILSFLKRLLFWQGGGGRP